MYSLPVFLTLCVVASLRYIFNQPAALPFEVPLSGRAIRAQSAMGGNGWQWTDIEPSRDLLWNDCFKGFQCARLDVPLDWLQPSEHERVVLAIIKLPASDVESYKGPVFINPGGPGGSGVYALKRNGKSLQRIIGLNHDLISFDPRGVGATTPIVDCWSSMQNRNIWALQDVGVIDSHPGVLYDAYARATALSRLCSPKLIGNGTAKLLSSDSPVARGISSFVSTTSTARDMLEILNRGGWEKLRYWGFSYGTMLGGMFAALWPEKVERMVNDGNVDYTEWTSTSHLNFLHDTDKVMDAFYHFCHLSGPSKCDFYSPSPQVIEARLDAILMNLKIHPIVAQPTQPGDLPELVTYSWVKRFISAALYRPINIFPSLAKTLAALENGDGGPFLNLPGVRKLFSCDCDACGMPPEPPTELEGTEDAFRSIMCTDGSEMNDTVEEFEQYSEHLIRQSKAAGAVNVLFRMSCAGWNVKAKWRFPGPFVANTGSPILFIANTADNVTPLRSALKNSEGFKDSVVLIQNSYGHTSLAAPSVCTASHIQAYFQHGLLPKPNTTCEAEFSPFDTIDDKIYQNAKGGELGSALLELMGTTRGWSFPTPQSPWGSQAEAMG